MTTLRSRITAVATAVVLGVLVVAGVALVVAQERVLTENVEEGLAQSADAIEATIGRGDMAPVLGGVGDDDAVAQVVDASGTVLASTPNVRSVAPVVEPARADGGPVVLTTDAIEVDDAGYRVLARPVATPDGPAVILVAASLGDVEESTATLITSLVVAVPLIVVLLALAIWWLIGRTLAPVEAIRAEVSDIGATELHRRVPQPSGNDEIARLARTMNAMLDRVEGASRRQSEFVADASHELRSPLTRMRTELEVDLVRPERSDLVATHRSLLAEAMGMQRLVEDLLHLARSDASGVPTSAAAVDLDDIALEQAQRVRAERLVSVDTTEVSAAQVLGDAQQLARAVANLVDNAVRHATASVGISVAEHDGRAVVAVSDDGPGIPPDQRERVFERFTRIDPARTGASGGSGLGLPIARDIVERHGGTLRVDGTSANGTRLVIELPLAAAASHVDR